MSHPCTDPPEPDVGLYLPPDAVARLSELAVRFDASDDHYDRVLLASRLIGVLHAAGLPIGDDQ